MEIESNMSLVLDTRNYNFGIQQLLQFQIWFIMILSYKMRQKFIPKRVRLFITKYDSFIQIATVIKKMR